MLFRGSSCCSCCRYRGVLPRERRLSTLPSEKTTICLIDGCKFSCMASHLYLGQFEVKSCSVAVAIADNQHSPRWQQLTISVIGLPVSRSVARSLARSVLCTHQERKMYGQHSRNNLGVRSTCMSPHDRVGIDMSRGNRKRRLGSELGDGSRTKEEWYGRFLNYSIS